MKNEQQITTQTYVLVSIWVFYVHEIMVLVLMFSEFKILGRHCFIKKVTYATSFGSVNTFIVTYYELSS